MSRLIDVDALINEIKKDTEKAIEQDDRNGSFWLGYIAGLVIKQPTIQPERAKGEWSDGYRWQRCSLCKQTGKKSWNYCPNCGAKMTISIK